MDIDIRLSEDFWVLLRKDFGFFFGLFFFFLFLLIFFSFQSFLGFSNKDLFFSFLAHIFDLFLLLHFFSSPSWKAGDHGPWIHLRCSLPVCVV